MLCFISCNGQSKEEFFLTKHGFKDFSQFKNVSVFIRGVDNEANPIIFVDAPFLVRDTSRVGCYIVILDKNNNQIKRTKWTLTEKSVNADTVKLQQLAQTFMQYEIPRLNVDEYGNVFVYLKDVETLGLVRTTNGLELLKHNNKVKLINIKDNWYKPI